MIRKSSATAKFFSPEPTRLIVTYVNELAKAALSNNWGGLVILRMAYCRQWIRLRVA